MRVIGLTGSIACGKSTVSNWLKTQPDCRVIDGDLLSRELTADGGPALPALRKEFGDGIFDPDGRLNRRGLGSIVFSNDAALSRLDEIMAPLLQSMTMERIQEAKADGVTLCFLDYPLLFEKGYDRLCDTVWCVYLPRQIQLRRLMARDHYTEEEALSRMDAVLSSEEKARRSQVVIDNSGDISFTLSTLPPLLAKEREIEYFFTQRESETSAGRRASPSVDVSGSSRISSDAARPRRRRSGGNDVSVSAERPESMADPGAVMERPSSARRKQEPRKAAWRLPSWMLASLIVCGFLVLGCFAGQWMMRAYLTRQAEQHQREQNAIYANYPMVYREIIEQHAAEFNLQPAFVSAIIRNESSFQPRAESSVGARGLMQLMPDTAEWIAGKLKMSGYAFERMYDPESNVRFGCWYLRYLANLFHGDPVCVACAYHAGQGTVTGWLSDSRYSSDGVTLNLQNLMDGPTKTYAGRVIRTYGIYQALYFAGDGSGAGADDAADAGAGQ